MLGKGYRSEIKDFCLYVENLKFVCRMFEVRMLNLWACKGLSEIT